MPRLLAPKGSHCCVPSYRNQNCYFLSQYVLWCMKFDVAITFYTPGCALFFAILKAQLRLPATAFSQLLKSPTELATPCGWLCIPHFFFSLLFWALFFFFFIGAAAINGKVQWAKTDAKLQLNSAFTSEILSISQPSQLRVYMCGTPFMAARLKSAALWCWFLSPH